MTIIQHSDEDFEIVDFDDSHLEPVTLPDPGAIKRINPRDLYAPFWAKVEQLLLNCEKRGVRYYVISGLRTFDEQSKLFAQGRTAPGNKVTWAKAGESFHNFGIAADFCRDKDMKRDGLQPEWDVAAYKVLAEEAEKLGLEPGLRWTKVDAPHVQLKISRFGLTLKDSLLPLFVRGGQRAVNALLDRYQW